MEPTSVPRTCVACGSTSLTKRQTLDASTLYECGACDLQFWWPFHNPGNTFYEVDNKESVMRNHDPLSQPLFAMQKHFLRHRPNAGGTLLDLGMGAGRFLAGAEKAGYTVSGCDFDTEAIQTAKDFWGLTDVHPLSVDEFVAKFPEKKFDVITMFEILEHLDGFDVIPKLHQLLNPGGLLVISTPWRGRWSGFFNGDNPPEHLTRWSDSAIRNFFEARGFRIRRMRHMTGAPGYFSRLLMRFSEWTSGWLSFGLSKKLTGKSDGATAPRVVSGKPVKRSVSMRNRVIRALSLTKLYGLFFIPTVLLYAYLYVTGGRHATSLYVIIEKSDHA